ncbi:MAG: PKD domain-containing protein, partial [Bacteroidia bacterium]
MNPGIHNSKVVFELLNKKVSGISLLNFIVPFICSYFCIFPAFSQTISYLAPDIGASSHNTYVEIIGPYDQNNNFGTDGVYLNNPGDAVRVVCTNNPDTNKIKIGPLVVSWNGRMISTQIFVMPGIAPNSTDWQLLSSTYKIPIQVVLNGTNVSNTDTFYIVQPQPAIISSGTGVLGSGGAWGIRSRRGAMIFDSLIFQNGANISASTSDCDAATQGNQGFLPVHVMSIGRTFIDDGALISVSAPGGQNTNGGPGGGGGGTESFTNCSPGAGGRNQSGDGFTGGGTELLIGEQPGGGTGSTPPPCAIPGHGGISLNGVPGGFGWTSCNVDQGGGGGGTGHPFGSSGGRDGMPGGYGGGAGYSGYGGGGFASDGTTPSTNENGKANGNAQMIPFSGGSAGGAGVAGSGTSRGGGGGGGGAITLHAFLTATLKPTAKIEALGGDGVIGCGGYRGGGGGSGGGILFTGKLSSQGTGTIAVNGGAGGVGGGGAGGQGGAGRVRVDGPFAGSPTINPTPGNNSASGYNGPSTDTTSFVARAFNLTGTGNGQPIRLYLKPINKPWQLVATITGYGTSWTQNIVLPCPDTSFLLVAAQQVPAPSTALYTSEPEWIFSQAATNTLIVKNALKANAGRDTSVCPGSCLTLGGFPSGTGGVLPYSYLWTPAFGLNNATIPNPSVCLLTSSQYTLTVTDSSGCFYTDTVNLNTYPSPVANFNHIDICLQDTVTFTDLSSVSAGSISNWSWDFGDGSSTSTIQHPKHKYAAAGTYTVTLIVTTNNGCKDTITKNVVVHALPVAQFTAPVNVCHGNIASFTDGSTIPNTDTIQSWSWNFADGSPLLNQQTVTGGHLYAATGTYNVSLITTSSFGCKDTITKTLFV